MLRPIATPYPQRRVDRIFWFWIDLVIFWLTTSAFHAAVLAGITGWSAPGWVVAVTGVGLLFAALVYYNRITMLISAFLMLVSAAVAVVLLGQNPVLEETWLGHPFFSVGKFLTLQSQAPSPYFVPCVMGILLAACLIWVALAFVFKGSLVALLLQVAGCLAVYFTSDRFSTTGARVSEGVLYGLCGVLCGVLYDLARRAFARGSAGRSFLRGFACFQRLFLPLFLSAALLGGVVAPTLLDEVTGEGWVRLVDWVISQGLSGANLNSETVGFYEDDRELGGDIELSDKPMFTVVSSRPVHLRARVYDHYDGRRWTDTLSEESETLLETVPMSAHGHGTVTAPGYVTPFSLDESYVQENYTFGSAGNTGYPLRALTYTIKDSKMFTRSIFSATYTKRATFLTSNNRISLDGSSVLTAARRTRGKRDDYTVSYLEPVEGTYSYWLNYRPWQSPRAEYLQMSDTVSESVKELALELTRRFRDPYKACQSLSDYLSQNQKYTTHPGEVPDGVDFVDYFLFENNQGYCVYYATALTILARAAGFPARYVEGFRSDEFNAARGKVLTGQNAHAWAEIYMDGVGWMTFDPVSVNQFASNRPQASMPNPLILPPTGTSSAQDKPSENQNDPPSPDDSEDSEDEPNEEEPDPSLKEQDSAGIPLWIWMVGGGLVVVAACLLRCLIHANRRKWRRKGCPPYLVLSTYREMERGLQALGMGRPASQPVETYLTCLPLCVEGLEEEEWATLCRSAARAVSRKAYSTEPPLEGDREALLRLTLLIEKAVEKKRGRLGFLWWWKAAN